MKTLKEIRRRIGSVEDMRSVVSTMKSLAAARIRQFETAADATRSYSETVELALQILMRQRETLHPLEERIPTDDPMGLILLGSDHGFCGGFNEAVLESASQLANAVGSNTIPPHVLIVGARMGQLAEASNVQTAHIFNAPGSVPEITNILQKVIPHLESWQRRLNVGRIELLYNQRRSTASYEVTQLQLAPLSFEFLRRLGERPWQSRCLPVYQGRWQETFSRVIRQYLFLHLFRACAESLASENASRMAAMHQAEKNIEKRLDELNAQFNQNRQRSITEELLEIMSGFEAVTTRGS